MVYKIVTAFSPWIMSNNLLTDVVRIREEILPRLKTMWCWIITRRNSSIGSRKSRHRAAYKTTYPSTPDTAASGAGAARIRRIEPEIEAGEERCKLSFPGGRTTMSNKDSATMTGKFIIFILNLFLAVFGRKETCLNTLRLIMNSQSHIRTEGVGGGCPPSHGREIFWKFVYENGIFFHTKWHY